MGIIQNPGLNWLERLRKGNRVWLVKENKEAMVEWAYEPPDPGHSCGRIGIGRPWMDSWYIDSNGNGIDGHPLMRPIEGELPENPEPLPINEIRRLQMGIEHLQHRLDYLERITLNSPGGVAAAMDLSILGTLNAIEKVPSG